MSPEIKHLQGIGSGLSKRGYPLKQYLLHLHYQDCSATQRPSQVIGMHFMNPVPVMQLVEIIRGLQTSQETFGTVKSLAEKMGKTLSKPMIFRVSSRIES